VQKEIKTYKGGKPFYFGGNKPLSDNGTRRVFLAYTKKAGLPQIRLHDLRHSFVSMLIHLGANFMVVADLIGDTVEQVTKTYGHLYQEDKMDIIARIK
jgi:site-specific recombinase XerD